jgi:hypothetical protein
MNIAVRAPVVRKLAMPDMLDVFDLEGSVAALAPEGFIRPKDDGEVHGYLDGTLGAAYGVVDDAGFVRRFALALAERGSCERRADAVSARAGRRLAASCGLPREHDGAAVGAGARVSAHAA